MATNAATVILKRHGRPSEELNASQVTIENLRRVFQVEPEDAWLQDDLNGRAYFPNEEGLFEGLDRNYQALVVQGTSLPGIFSRMQSQIPASSPGSAGVPSSLPSPPTFRSVLSTSSGTRKASYCLKIVKATLSWQGNKAIFKHIVAGFIEIDENTAKVDYILKEVKRMWGDLYIIVTNEGLQLVDSEATQGILCTFYVLYYTAMLNYTGLAFWKNPRRKIYAVLKTDSLKGKAGRCHSQISAESESDDDFQPRRKKNLIEDKLNTLIDEVNSLKENVSDVMQLSKESKIPLGLKRIVRDSFKCKICHAVPINPPVIMSKCCKTLIGCEPCINTLYSGPDALTKPCPCCRSERGYNETMVLRGIDEFLQSFKRVATEEETQGETFDEVANDPNN